MLYIVLMIGLTLLALRLLRRRNKAVRRREKRRQARMQRTIKTRGIALGTVKVCDCGEPAGRCREMTRRAEHPKGMLE